MTILARYVWAAAAISLLSGFSLFVTEKDKAANCLVVSRFMIYGETSKLLDRAASQRLGELVGQDCDHSDPRDCLRQYSQAVDAAGQRAFPDGDTSNTSNLKDLAKESDCEGLMTSYHDSIAPKAGAAATAPAPDSPAAMTDLGGGVLRQNNSLLQWMQFEYNKNMSWKAAGAFCSQVDFAGGHWRLPKTAELRSIFDSRVTGILCGSSYICKVSPLFKLPNRTVWSADSSGYFDAELVSLDDGSQHVISMAGSVDEPIGELCVRTADNDGHSLAPTAASEPAPSPVPAGNPSEAPVAKKPQSPPNPQDIAAAQTEEWHMITLQMDPMANPNIYVSRCVDRLTASAMRFGMSREEASTGVAERCEQLVTDAHECAGVSPSRPKRCNGAR